MRARANNVGGCIIPLREKHELLLVAKGKRSLLHCVQRQEKVPQLILKNKSCWNCEIGVQDLHGGYFAEVVWAWLWSLFTRSSKGNVHIVLWETFQASIMWEIIRCLEEVRARVEHLAMEALFFKGENIDWFTHFILIDLFQIHLYPFDGQMFVNMLCYTCSLVWDIIVGCKGIIDEGWHMSALLRVLKFWH